MAAGVPLVIPTFSKINILIQIYRRIYFFHAPIFNRILIKNYEIIHFLTAISCEYRLVPPSVTNICHRFSEKFQRSIKQLNAFN